MTLLASKNFTQGSNRDLCRVLTSRRLGIIGPGQVQKAPGNLPGTTLTRCALEVQ
jgi:hypothetical protein